MSAIDDQMQRGMMLKNEYFLTDAISIMIESGAKFRTNEISTWLDTGTIEATLDTNKHLLKRLNPSTSPGQAVSTVERPGVKVIPPVAIHPTAEISNSTVGPFTSIGANCKIENSQIADSILEAECEIKDAALSRSLIGKQATVKGRNDGHVMQLNIGDSSSIIL